MKDWTWTAGIAGLALLAACSFDTSPSAGNTADLGETESDSDETSATETGPNETSTSGGSASSTSPTDPSDPTSDPSDPTSDPSDPTTDPTTDPSTDTDTSDPTTDTDATGDEPAAIEIDGPDFGTVDYGSTPTRTYTLTNAGGTETQNLAVNRAGPFDVESDDCPASLEPAATCSVTVSHNADTLGPFSGELRIGHDTADGFQEFARPLEVDVTGETENLIPDPGFESCKVGALPAGWIQLAGEWYCGGPWATPEAGVRFLSGGASVPGENEFDIRFIVDLTPYEEAISTGSMTFEFQGHAATSAPNNDVYWLRVRYRNAGGMDTSQYDSASHTGSSWVLYDDERTVPDDTVEAYVDLHCQRNNGDYCNAFFDTLALVGTYQP
ncbi:MAG: hypothetical protein ACRBN8_15430 [Nannocystales bacterium]